MNITESFKCLKSLYKEGNININNMLRIDFIYNNIKSFLLFKDMPPFANIFVVVWKVNNTYYLQSYYVNEKNSNYFFNPYIDNQIFFDIKSIFKINSNYSIKSYFEYIFENLDQGTRSQENIKRLKNYNKNLDQIPEYIYFSHFRRGNMSTEMKEKIEKYFNKDIAHYIKSNKNTAVFTNDIEKSNDIKTELLEKFPSFYK